jgi:hypothetical protein
MAFVVPEFRVRPGCMEAFPPLIVEERTVRFAERQHP